VCVIEGAPRSDVGFIAVYASSRKQKKQAAEAGFKPASAAYGAESVVWRTITCIMKVKLLQYLLVRWLSGKTYKSCDKGSHFFSIKKPFSIK
jgi:hypothetical protein